MGDTTLGWTFMKDDNAKKEILVVSSAALFAAATLLFMGYLFDVMMIRYVAGVIAAFTIPLIMMTWETKEKDGQE